MCMSLVVIGMNEKRRGMKRTNNVNYKITFFVVFLYFISDMMKMAKKDQNDKNSIKKGVFYEMI